MQSEEIAKNSNCKFVGFFFLSIDRKKKKRCFFPLSAAVSWLLQTGCCNSFLPYPSKLTIPVLSVFVGRWLYRHVWHDERHDWEHGKNLQ